MDNGRCLEQLSFQVQRLTLVEVQKLLIEGDVEKGSDLLSHWEHYIELSNYEPVSGPTPETLSSTVGLFCKRLGALQNVLNSLPKQKCVKDLREKLNALEERFSSTKICLNGGKFEWVDSILVKCLREGSWLMIDNVNLCSPAVLDRLNGVLEPGGELVLGERGVGADGQLVVVKPHPNFRLFLVMDPRFGEISRAMRNRGVELFLLDGIESPAHFLDLQAIMSHMGLVRYNHQTALLNIHREMKNLAIGFDPVTKNDMFKVVALTVEQALRGESLSTSLRTACSDVYVHSRQLTPDQRERCDRLLGEVFKEFNDLLITPELDTRDYLVNREVTLCTLALQENSAVAQLRQKSVLLSTVLKLVRKSHSCTLKDILKDNLLESGSCMSGKRVIDLVPHILVTLISSITENDLNLRRHIILSTIMLFSSKELRSKLLELEKFLTSTVQQAIKSENLGCLKGTLRKDLCWDLRRVSPWILDKKSRDHENKTIALLYYFMQCLEMNIKLGEVKNTSVKKMSALEFSTAYNKGKVTVENVRCQEVLNLSVFLETLEDQVHSLLESSSSLDEDQCCRLLCAFHWSHRLIRLSQQPLFVGRSRQLQPNEELVTLLQLHVNWIRKWLFPELTRLLTRHTKRQESGKLPSQLTEMCVNISLAHPVRSMSKKVRMLKGQPLPRCINLQGELSETLRRLETTINVGCVDQTRQLIQKKVEFLLSIEGKQLRKNLIQAHQLVNSSEHLEEARESLNIKFPVFTPHLSGGDATVRDIAERRHASSWSWEIPLWPIRGVVCLRLMASMRLLNHKLAECVRDWVQELPLVLPGAVALLTPAHNHLQAETALTRELSQSPTVTTPRPWLRWASLYDCEGQSAGVEDNDYFPDERKNGSGEVYPLHTPILALYSTTLLYPQCHLSADISPAIASLRSLPSHAKLLAALKQVLWTHGPTLAANSLNYRQNEEKCVNKAYLELLEILKTAVDSKLLCKELPPNEKQIYLIFLELIQTKSLGSSIVKDQSKEVEILSTELLRHIETLEISFKQILEENNENVRLLLVGLAWIHLGLAQVRLFSHQDSVDPVQKRTLKVQYCQEEREDLEKSLAVEQVQGLFLGSFQFPLAGAFSKRIEFLETKEDSLRKFVAVRPQPNLYSSLYNEIQQFMAVIVNPGQRVETVASSLRACIITSEAVESVTIDKKKMLEAIARAHSLQASLRSSVDNFNNKYYTWYPDVVVPIVSAITQISHGLSLMIGAAKKVSFNENLDVESLLKTIIRFPLPDCSAAQELVEVCTSTHTLELIKAIVTPKLKEGETSSNEIFRLAKCSLEELLNVVTVRGWAGEERDWSVVCGILDHLVRAWQWQEQERARKELEESSYYINKAKNVKNLTEEEEDEIEMKKLFPSYRDKDFADLEPPSLEQKKVTSDSDFESTDPNFKLTLENIVKIHKVHSAIVTKHTKAHWLNPTDPDLPDFSTPFADRLAVFSVLLDSLYAGCDSRMDAEITPALCLGVKVVQSYGTVDLQNRRKHYNFYHDANVGEVKNCVPVLESLSKRVLELLDEWPDHPTLKQIMLVVNRILEFPSHSPVSRFLVGMELLLTKLKEWEENAHAGVTLGPHSASVTQLILDWRRLELTQWKGCLESARLRLSESAVSKWWFHLYSLLKEENDLDAGKLASVLNQFMEESNLAEYQARLTLLYTFHCHAINSHLKLQSQVLWNVHKYYSQFNQIITHRVKELSLPVEKKLRDFVKIARWNDINYWAVKETVEKTHRTLLKYIREYESILKQPARLAMTRLDSVSKQSFNCLPINPALYLAPSILAESLPEDVEGESVLCRKRSLFSRARKLCRDYIVNCQLPQHITALHQVTDELHEVAELLAVEDVDRTVSKEKQKSAARSVLHRKRKALTDIFHTLASLGLSYRAGLVALGDQEEHFTSHSPLNVEAGLAQIDIKSADRELKAAWEGCDVHWLHCIARQALLRTALAKPHKDLGPPVVDRCKGFTNHLMSLCHQQKESVSESVTSLYVLRCLIQLLTSLQPCHSELPNIKNALSSLVDDVIYCLAQFEVLMDSCPEAPTIVDTETFLAPLIPETVEVTVYNGDENWINIKLKVTSAMKHCKKIKTLLDGKAKFSQFLETLKKTNDLASLKTDLTHVDIQAVKDGYAMLASVQTDIRDIQRAFRMTVECDKNPMAESLKYLQDKIYKSTENFSLYQNIIKEFETPIEEEQTEVTVGISEEVVLNKVLIAIQESYKSIVQHEENTEVSDSAPVENGLFDSHLKDKIVLALKNEVCTLKISEVNRELQELITMCKNSSNWGLNSRMAKSCLPLLHQYSLLVQYVVTQQVCALNTSAHLCSDLLAVFADLANKGFRVPEELLEEEDGDGTETSTGGMGLGEGEGEKDVSDQIENQDQLEDAKKPGEHDKEEDKDCKEEEKGIDMTDDFGGKLQDIEKQEDEDGSGRESGEEEEPDKEMGDTEKGAETLDQEIWGGDSDSEEEEEGDREEEQGDRGEQLGEREFGAKDENKTPQGKEDDRQGNEEKNEKKKEINEMEEPEVDDDQIDPYHGKNPPQPEPEPLDLPDDLQLDDGENNDKDGEGEEENPFEIDNMKEPKLPEEEEEGGATENDSEKKDDETNKENDPETDSSDEDIEGEGDNQDPEAMDVDQTEEKLDDQTMDDGGAKDENKTGEEAKIEEDKEKEEEEEAKPSEDHPSSESVPSAQQEAGSKDQVRQPENIEQSKELNPEESDATEGPDQQGVGATSNNKQEAQRGSSGESSQAVQAHSRELREEKRQRPGDSEEQRTLGDVQEPLKKKLKTINLEKEDKSCQEQTEEEGIKEDQTSDMYQHITDAKETNFEAQTLDAATEEQVAEQKFPNKEDEEADELKDDQDMAMDEEEQTLDTEKVTNVNPEKLKEANEDKNNKEGTQQPATDGDRVEADTKMQVDGELIETSTVQRGAESTFHTQLDDGFDVLTQQVDIEHERRQLEHQLSTWSQPPAKEEATQAWERLSNVTADLSRELSEQLRLVLEPTHASRLKGDFRTGRRINMRKVIPYIASQFRKDKIWLRRTKPAKREYQIVLAVDDSSSMADNHSKELAFESLAVVSKALSLLEAGELAVLSFGDQPTILHQLGDPFTEHCGARLLQQFSFEQQKTHVGALVNFVCSLFSRHPPRRGVTDVAQLLVIVSDGRGVLSDGEGVVMQAVRRAKQMGIFMVFVIVDNPQSKDSILDIRLPKFSGGKLLGIVPYMDSFPFPFYLILRDINSLPSVLSDALRQWFELVTTTS